MKLRMKLKPLGKLDRVCLKGLDIAYKIMKGGENYEM